MSTKIYLENAQNYTGKVDLVVSNIYGPLPKSLSHTPAIVTQFSKRLPQILEWTARPVKLISFWNDLREAAWSIDLPRKDCDLSDLRPDGDFFPIELPLRLLQTFAEPGMIICDPYCGRGTVGKACQMLGMSFIGVDCDPARVEMAREYLL